MTINKINIEEVKLNQNNPRIIKDDKFKKLVKSIKEFPQMLNIRPIVVDENNIVLGGNMRLKACKEAGLKEVPIIKASELTEEQKKEFIVKDNLGYGEWDYELLLEYWKKEDLVDWGMDIPKNSTLDEYTKKIEIPLYEPSDIKPFINDLYNTDKYDELINDIDNSNIDDKEKSFLKIAATRHIIFNYDMIADYYSNSNKDIQELMEKSALVLVDFNKAIEYGFIKLTDDIKKQYSDEYGE